VPEIDQKKSNLTTREELNISSDKMETLIKKQMIAIENIENLWETFRKPNDLTHGIWKSYLDDLERRYDRFCQIVANRCHSKTGDEQCLDFCRNKHRYLGGSLLPSQARPKHETLRVLVVAG